MMAIGASRLFVLSPRLPTFVAPLAPQPHENRQPTLSRMSLTQSGNGMSQGLDGVRKAAKERKQERFTSLLHHLTVDLLRDSFYALQPQNLGAIYQTKSAVTEYVVGNDRISSSSPNSLIA